jgi:hypothetical protein
MIIRPNKFACPEETVVSFASLLVEVLKKEKVVKFDMLYTIAKEKNMEALFMPAVDFLFLLGLLSYYPVNDVFVLERR